MSGILKYFLGLYTVLALLCSGANAEDMLFDPIDVLTGHPVIQQGHHQYAAHTNAQDHKKDNCFSSDHKHSKKYNSGKHNSSEIYFHIPDDATMFLPSEAITLTPNIPTHYRYLFYREINPPPPRSC